MVSMKSPSGFGKPPDNIACNKMISIACTSINNTIDGQSIPAKPGMNLRKILNGGLVSFTIAWDMGL